MYIKLVGMFAVSMFSFIVREDVTGNRNTEFVINALILKSYRYMFFSILLSRTILPQHKNSFVDARLFIPPQIVTPAAITNIIILVKVKPM